MKKIISLFKRDYEGNRLVYDEIVEGAEWVINGEGEATQKLDGTCCLIENGKYFKRYEVKKNKKPPKDFIPACDIDIKTGKQQGWVPVGVGPEDKYHRLAFKDNLQDGIYELIGEKIQGNPENITGYLLVKHGSIIIKDVPRNYEELKKWFKGKDIEGVVWHHPDGRMVKIKAKDFGIKRNI